ncbi:MAG: 50S ribosomal protein L24 [Polyangiales bacterium]
MVARIRQGDTVCVIAGKDKGEHGEVLFISRERQRAVVRGLNMVKKHVRPGPTSPEGGIVEMEAAIHLSNLMPIDPESKRPTRVRTRVDSDGKKTRVAVRSGAVLSSKKQ